MKQMRAPASARAKAMVVLAGVLLVVFGAALIVPDIADHFADGPGGGFIGDVSHGWSDTVLHPQYWAFLLVVGLLELQWPARDGEGLFTVGGAQDLGWFLLTPIFTLTVFTWSLQLVGRVYEGPLQSASLNAEDALGTIPTIVIVIVVADFFLFLSHFIRHKVPPLWRFHQVHHSQTRMSPLTDKRFHFVEPLTFIAIAIIPAALLGLNLGVSRALIFATLYLTAFQHANLRWNMGIGRWLLVTPQSHRIHHSTQPQHWEHNFGAVFSVWDRLFRTHWHGVDEYPPIGIDDQAFPLERRGNPLEVVGTYARQTVYPFRRVGQDLRAPKYSQGRRSRQLLGGQRGGRPVTNRGLRGNQPDGVHHE